MRFLFKSPEEMTNWDLAFKAMEDLSKTGQVFGFHFSPFLYVCHHKLFWGVTVALGWRDLVKYEAKAEIYPHDRKPLPRVKVQCLHCEVILLILAWHWLPKKVMLQLLQVAVWGCSLQPLPSSIYIFMYRLKIKIKEKIKLKQNCALQVHQEDAS